MAAIKKTISKAKKNRDKIKVNKLETNAKL
jgi:hypothetical protein